MVNLSPRKVVMWVGGNEPRREFSDITPETFGPERANEIMAQCKAKATHGPWSDQLDKTLKVEEKAYVLSVWDTMPGNTSFLDAFFRILNNRLEG